MLTEAMNATAGKRARKIIDEKGYLGWEEYVEAIKEEVKQNKTRFVLTKNTVSEGRETTVLYLYFW